MKKLQSPLFEEFNNSLNPMCSISAVGSGNKENLAYNCNLPPKSRSPNRVPSRRYSAAVDVAYTASPENRSKHVSDGSSSHQAMQEPKSPPYVELKEVPNQEPDSLRFVNCLFSNCCYRHRLIAYYRALNRTNGIYSKCFPNKLEILYYFL